MECRDCDVEFEPKHNWQKYCSEFCRLKKRKFIDRLRPEHNIWIKEKKYF